MAVHDQLQIHRTGVRLLALAVRVQEQLPRSVKKILGERIMQHCVDMLALMALANASQAAMRAGYIQRLLAEQSAATDLFRVSFNARYLTAPKLWAESMELLGSIGAQAGGWLKSAKAKTAKVEAMNGAPAA